MAGKFLVKKFAEINLNDSFLDSLKDDYPATTNNVGFEQWFMKKAASGSSALVFSDEYGLGAFLCLKR